MTELPASILKELLPIIATQTDELTSSPSGSEWQVRAMSPSHVTMVSALIQAPCFGDGICVRVADMQKAVSNLSPQDDVSLEVEGSALVVRSGRYTTRMPVFDPSGSPSKVPHFDGASKAVITPADVLPILKNADPKAVSVVTLSIDDSGLLLRASDGQYGQEVLLPPEECLDFAAGDGALGTYPLREFSALLKAAPSQSPVTISLDTAAPVTIALRGFRWEAEWMCAPWLEAD